MAFPPQQHASLAWSHRARAIDHQIKSQGLPAQPCSRTKGMDLFHTHSFRTLDCHQGRNSSCTPPLGSMQLSNKFSVLGKLEQHQHNRLSSACAAQNVSYIKNFDFLLSQIYLKIMAYIQTGWGQNYYP